MFQILNEQEVSQEASIIQPEESEKRELESSEEVESLEPATKKFKPDDQPEAVATAVVWNFVKNKNTLMTKITDTWIHWKSSQSELSRRFISFFVFLKYLKKKFIVERYFAT